MPFAKKPQVFSAKINELTLGTGDKAATLGGQNVFNLYTFDAPIANRPKIGIDVSDDPEQPSEGLKAFYAGCNTLAERAKKAAELPEADFVCIRFDLADPNGENKSIEDCVADAKAVAEAVDKPIVVAGCKNSEKDADLFGKISEALQGKNILVLSAKEENYKGVAAGAGMAYGQKVGAESAVDINLAKQLNVLITQMGVNGENVAMNVGSAAAGYGFEYVVSTLERVKAAALSQNDSTLQMPIITPVGVETWGVKEATASESDAPEWGAQEERGIDMEVETAAACLAYGSDAVILKHPVSIQTTARLVAALM
ncbi:MAG: acetyl-CoA decarbonylase/synthase complex subunit delta [Oscillospiraceae bacterium]|jgi:acetyl-CoA decarbonylase/synthase complex subunit delta|nr:acetyl-CoA decarbonylase/synthase complex subunit delta [Oscillospiraceae bacterium]MCI9391557.1 acetyl-CoA decarbonylase/synthase complex subunit delta [Oscillospiraceae bacterium]